MIIFKVLRDNEYKDLRIDRLCDGSKSDIQDGFIHLSTNDQLAGTVKKHFQNEKSLILMAVNSEELGDNLIWEKARGEKLFPHFYGKLKYNMALWFAPLEFYGDHFLWPSGL